MKKLFYYTDVLTFLSREDVAIEKLKRSLSIFREASNAVTLVWHPYSGTLDYLKRNDSPVTEEYISIFEDYRNTGWGELDLSASIADAKKTLLSCCAYYGDVSDLVYEAQNAGLPVMLQNIDI